MKLCSRCKREITLEVASKDKNSKDGLNCYCKICLKEIYYEKRATKNIQRAEFRLINKERLQKLGRDFYANNRERIIAKARITAKERRHIIREHSFNRKEQMVAYLGGVCKTCGNIYHPTCMDFHHRNPLEKEHSLNTLRSCKWDRIKMELDKCDLLCANCHRLHHFENGGTNAHNQ